MPYKMKVPSKRRPRFGVNRLSRPVANEGLTGWVNGKEASDIEERFARALRNNNVDYSFRIDIPTAVSIPGEDKEIDFLIGDAVRTAVEIDGEIGHKTEGQQARDIVREILVNEQLKKAGIRPTVRIPWTKLLDQETANRTVQELL